METLFPLCFKFYFASKKEIVTTFQNFPAPRFSVITGPFQKVFYPVLCAKQAGESVWQQHFSWSQQSPTKKRRRWADPAFLETSPGQTFAMFWCSAIPISLSRTLRSLSQGKSKTLSRNQADFTDPLLAKRISLEILAGFQTKKSFSFLSEHR